jgi:hypothetical protein
MGFAVSSACKILHPTDPVMYPFQFLDMSKKIPFVLTTSLTWIIGVASKTPHPLQSQSSYILQSNLHTTSAFMKNKEVYAALTLPTQ